MPELFIPPPADEVFERLPKCNLHTHLEGSVRPNTFLDLARNQNIQLPFDPDDVEKHFQVTGDERTLVDYLDKIMVNYQVLKNAEALRRCAYEAAEDAHFDGVVYFELRAGPLTHTSNGLPLEACIESMLTGLKQAEDKYGIICRLIVAGLRNHSPEKNVELAKICLRYIDEGVVAFDLAGDENGYHASLHQDAFDVIRDSDLGITVHAGEASGWKNVYHAVEEIGARRIGHGVRSIESPKMLDILREKQVLLEICPTSNVHTGTFPNIADHPVKKLFDYGIPISIGDDDPITSRTLVSQELTLINRVFGFSLEQIAIVQLMSIDHSFLRESDLKAQIRSQIQKFLDIPT